MATPFLGEVKIISWNFPPKGWAFCTGQILPINQNQALFSLLGTTFGGNGQTTFGLPNLQGQTAIGMGNGAGLPPASWGQTGGEAGHTLSIAEMPGHIHTASAANQTPNINEADGTLPAAPASPAAYTQDNANLSALVAGSIGKNGSGQPHNNLQPYLVLNFIIALSGIFPTRS